MGKQLYNKQRERFRTTIKQVRLDAGLTQVELADKLKRHQSYVSDYERGHRRLDWVAIEEVLVACQTNLVHFSKWYLAGGPK
ncbi:helix-turn-helix domain-containing protein [Stenotrophobium rhamnosiphilum]|uniref:Transcriptional regulator n=1 Tax=Stenotrophobium rhamnosiphilum TaxID=2029166 RepID=A0A2T5MIM0_9GAMM|nr:helix-turn-helix transcriptional regulator [Stenotrophobium rhamnosiphilum]PTU32408.1 transcriptional regulator [Stenotrophobium rhamnosiphilum]